LAVRRIEEGRYLESNRPDPRVNVGSEHRHLAIENALVLNEGRRISRIPLRHFTKDFRRRDADLRVRIAHGGKELQGVRKRKPG
jgi:hypothetical protein